MVFNFKLTFPPPPPPPPPSPKPSTTRTVSSYTFMRPTTVGPPPPPPRAQGTVFFGVVGVTMMVIELDHIARGGEPLLRTREMLASRSVNIVRHPRGSYIVTPFCLWSGHTRKQSNSLALPSTSQESRRKVPNSVFRAVLGRMQFTLHATRRTLDGASRLVQVSNVCLVRENLTCSVPASSGCEGQRSYDYGHAQTEYTAPPPPLSGSLEK